jgi:hypothetical protein
MSSHANSQIKPGTYRHFKGGIYRVQFVAMLVDSEREFVVYHRIGDENCLYLRDKNEFAESIMVDGTCVPRFEYVGSIEGQNGGGMDSGNKRRVRARRLGQSSRPSLSTSAGVR